MLILVTHRFFQAAERQNRGGHGSGGLEEVEEPVWVNPARVETIGRSGSKLHSVNFTSGRSIVVNAADLQAIVDAANNGRVGGINPRAQHG